MTVVFTHTSAQPFWLCLSVWLCFSVLAVLFGLAALPAHLELPICPPSPLPLPLSPFPPLSPCPPFPPRLRFPRCFCFCFSLVLVRKVVVAHTHAYSTIAHIATPPFPRTTSFHSRFSPLLSSSCLPRSVSRSCTLVDGCFMRYWLVLVAPLRVPSCRRQSASIAIEFQVHPAPSPLPPHRLLPLFPCLHPTQPNPSSLPPLPFPLPPLPLPLPPLPPPPPPVPLSVRISICRRRPSTSSGKIRWTSRRTICSSTV